MLDVCRGAAARCVLPSPVQLVFTLIFMPDGQLDPTYSDQYPWERKLQVGVAGEAGWGACYITSAAFVPPTDVVFCAGKLNLCSINQVGCNAYLVNGAVTLRCMLTRHCPVCLVPPLDCAVLSLPSQNIPFILYHHLNHEDNRPLLPHLLPRLAGVGQPALRLARLLCSALFRPEWYSGRCRISNAVGAYSTVYRACLPPWAGEGTVVLKLVDTPHHIQDRCAQVGCWADRLG